MNRENVAMFNLRPAMMYDDGRKVQVYRSLLEGIAAIPGVKAVGANTAQLLTGGRSDGSITVPGLSPEGQDSPSSYFNLITPGYFEALGIPIKLGRDVSWRDWGSAKKYCLVNEALVSEYFQGRNPVGRMIGRGRNVPADYEIIGVFGNSRYEDVRGKIPRQTFFGMDSRIRFANGMNVFARIQGDPRAVMTQLREQVARIDSNIVVSNMRTMDDQLNLRLANERVLSFLSIGFALLAAILAVTGLYGVLTFVVARRSREIGIRVALGAQQGGVVKLVLREMLVVIAGGIVAGVVAGLYCGRFLESQLYGVKPFDAQVFAASAVLLATFSLGAAFLPAWRASRLDPTIALRE
jgi:predicted permease